MKTRNIFAVIAGCSLLISTGRSQDPTTAYVWDGGGGATKTFVTAANWEGDVGPLAGSSNILIFASLNPNPKPQFGTSWGTTIVIFSNNAVAFDIAGGANTMWLGSYFRCDSSQLMYFGGTGTHFKLGDATVGGQTDFQINAGSVLLYSYLEDGQDGLPSKLIKSGAGTMRILDGGASTDNTYSGGTVVNGGTLQLYKAAGINAIPGNITINAGTVSSPNGRSEQIANTGIVTIKNGALYQPGATETIGSIESDGANTTGTASIGANSLILQPDASGAYNVATGVSAFYGNITSAAGGSLTKNGTGEFRMLGSANSVDIITVSAGTLVVNGNSGTGIVTVNGSGTLLGTGTIVGPVTVAGGCGIGAGGSVGQLTLPNGLDMQSGGGGATNIWELGANTTSGPGVNYDQIVVSGGSVYLGTATLRIQFTGTATAPNAGDPFWQSPQSWKIISLITGALNPLSSNFATIENGNYAAGNFSVSLDGSGSVMLNFTPSGVPAPARPRITSITGAGTGSIVVNYTNTVPTKTYYLRYKTSITGNWTTNPPGGKVAAGYTDSQTDTPVSGAQRYYQVWYVNP